jgi:hypothetical protein
MRVIERIVSCDAIELIDLDAQALSWTVSFMERYSDIGAQIADAALIIIAER